MRAQLLRSGLPFDNSDLRRAGLRSGSPSLQVRSAVAGPVVGPQEIGAELVEARAADLAHDEVDLVDENIDRLLDPGKAASSRAVQRRPPEEAEIGAEAQRDQDVGAA